MFDNSRAANALRRPGSVAILIFCLLFCSSPMRGHDLRDRGDEVEQEIKCGLSSGGQMGQNAILKLIVGGRPALPGEFPHQARLAIDGNTCGGSIIDERHILTAAHCVYEPNSNTKLRDPSSIRIFIGDHNKAVNDGETEVHIEAVIPHPGYEKQAAWDTNDISLIRTSEPMRATPIDIGLGSVNKICLPSQDQEYEEGTMLTVSGWGKLNNDDDMVVNILRTVDVPVYNFEECKRRYHAEIETNGELCAGYERGGKDSCQGDSGGPLIRRLPGGQAELVGIVSFGHACADEDFPGVYAKVSHYINWIKENMNF